MNMENVVYIHNRALFSHKEDRNYVVRKMGGIGAHHVKRNKADSETEILHIFSHIPNLEPKKMKKRHKYIGLCFGGDPVGGVSKKGRVMER
jgi:hypothetical protein